VTHVPAARALETVLISTFLMKAAAPMLMMLVSVLLVDSVFASRMTPHLHLMSGVFATALRGALQ
jgi:hypothetical protein